MNTNFAGLMLSLKIILMRKIGQWFAEKMRVILSVWQNFFKGMFPFLYFKKKKKEKREGERRER